MTAVSGMRMNRLPMKSMLVVVLKNSRAMDAFLLVARRSDGELVHGAHLQVPLEDGPRDEYRREEAGDDADHHRDREPLDGAGPELEEDERGDEARHVAVEDGEERPGEAGVHRAADRLAAPQLLADALVDEHVGV